MRSKAELLIHSHTICALTPKCSSQSCSLPLRIHEVVLRSPPAMMM